MKTLASLMVLLLLVNTGLLHALPAVTGSQNNQQDTPPPTTFTIVKNDADSRVWQREVYEKTRNGTVVTNVEKYTELASGLNHLVNGQWVESKEEIDILPDGTAAATNGQHQVYFPSDIYNEEIELVTPDGKILKSQPVGLNYDDGSNIVFFAVLTNSVGQLVNSNQVVYPNAFCGLNADLRYTYTKAGLEQDVILREQPPAPESLGLNPQTTELEVYTHFINPPPASVTDSKGLEPNEYINWGTMSLAPGTAFDLGGDESDQTPVAKQYLTIQGLQYLVEKVRVRDIESSLSKLPLQTSAKLKLPVVASKNRLLPEHPLVRGNSKPIKLAMTSPSNKGYVLDYVALTTITNDFTFQGDTTYYLSATVSSSYNLTFEGGTVIKYARGVKIIEGSGTLSWPTDAYRPAIFTAVDDNSVGQTITGISTGAPSGYYANRALYITVTGSGDVSVSNLRVSYATWGLYCPFTSGPITINNAQFINCYSAIYENSGNTAYVNNTLLENIGGGAAWCYPYGPNSYTFQNDTFDNVNYAVENTSGGGAFYNCVFVNTTVTPYGQASPVGDPNGFFNTSPFGSSPITSSSYPLQTLGGGNCYLTNGCGFQGAGMTGIDPAVLAELRQKTTYPPILYSNVIFSTNITLSPVVPRDTNATPDLGYHYDPIDYLCGEVYVTNATMTVNPGTAIGCFGIMSDGSYYSLGFDGGAQFLCQGLANNLNRIAEYSTVQESYPSTNWCWGSGGHSYCAIVDGVDNWNTGAVFNCRFTDMSCLCYDAWHFAFFNDDGGSVNFRDCQFHEGQIDEYDPALINLTNCLFERVISEFAPPLPLVIRNNLFFGGEFQFYIDADAATNSVIKDNDFDHIYGGLYLPPYTNVGFNAYVLSTNRVPLLTNSYAPSDIILTNPIAYEAGPFGNYYQPTNSPLIHMGSTTADQVGLYHYTVTTNEVVEGTNTVSIGYHYVATDTNGVPLDTNEDGIPDYLEDANGNGLVDSGEIGWNIFGDLGLKVIITRPRNGSILP